MDPKSPGLERLIGDMAPPGRRMAVDDGLPEALDDETARNIVQETLATTRPADPWTNGRKNDFSRSWRQLQASSQEIALSEPTEDLASVRLERQRNLHLSREELWAPPAHNLRHQSKCAIDQTTTSKANSTRYQRTKAENGKKVRTLTARAPLRKLAPLPSTSPFILTSQVESMEALRPLPTNSPLVLRSQPEEERVWGHSSAKTPFVQKAQCDETVMPAMSLEAYENGHGGCSWPSRTPSSSQILSADGQGVASDPPDPRISHESLVRASYVDPRGDTVVMRSLTDDGHWLPPPPNDRCNQEAATATQAGFSQLSSGEQVFPSTTPMHGSGEAIFNKSTKSAHSAIPEAAQSERRDASEVQQRKPLPSTR